MCTELSGKFSPAPGIVARQIADQWLLIPLHGTGEDLQKVYMLNEVSASIWRLLEHPQSLEELVSTLHGEYAAPEETIRQDTSDFLVDLVHRGFAIRECVDE